MHRGIPPLKIERAAAVAELADITLDKLHVAAAGVGLSAIANAADRRRAPVRDPVAHYTGMAEGAEYIAELRSMCELVEQSARDTWDYHRTLRREHFEDVWADEQPEQFNVWQKAAKLAACRPEVEPMAGHCWDCERDLRPVTLYPDPVPPGRFLDCSQHARWVVAGERDE